MTRDELKDLACLGFSADMVMQSFLPQRLIQNQWKMHHELPDLLSTRGGVSPLPGDGVILPWLNRLLLLPTQSVPAVTCTPVSHRYFIPAGSWLFW